MGSHISYYCFINERMTDRVDPDNGYPLTENDTIYCVTILCKDGTQRNDSSPDLNQLGSRLRKIVADEGITKGRNECPADERSWLDWSKTIHRRLNPEEENKLLALLGLKQSQHKSI